VPAGCICPQPALLYEHMFVSGLSTSDTGAAHIWI
jgi:hypothetical protein